MDLIALYDYLTSKASAAGFLGSFSWVAVAEAAKVDPLEDTTAFRALIEKGAMRRVSVSNTYGDVDYILTIPAPEQRDAFRATLRTVGARWRA